MTNTQTAQSIVAFDPWILCTKSGSNIVHVSYVMFSYLIAVNGSEVHYPLEMFEVLLIRI